MAETALPKYLSSSVGQLRDGLPGLYQPMSLNIVGGWKLWGPIRVPGGGGGSGLVAVGGLRIVTFIGAGHGTVGHEESDGASDKRRSNESDERGSKWMMS